jgi:hypothetical protein
MKTNKAITDAFFWRMQSKLLVAFALWKRVELERLGRKLAHSSGPKAKTLQREIRVIEQYSWDMWVYEMERINASIAIDQFD